MIPAIYPVIKKTSEKTVPIGKKCPSLIKLEKPKQDIVSIYYWLKTWNHSKCAYLKLHSVILEGPRASLSYIVLI